MNATAWIRIVAITAFGFSCSAHAECAFPKAPASIPDGKTASEADMLAAMQLKTMQSRKLNAAVEELKDKAKLFNEQVRIYKARA